MVSFPESLPPPELDEEQKRQLEEMKKRDKMRMSTPPPRYAWTWHGEFETEQEREARIAIMNPAEIDAKFVG